MLEDKVLKTIEKYNLIEKGNNVIVGFSGGPDSLCLLHILYKISEKYNLKLYAVHINHMLRGEESDEDEAFARRFCESFGIPIHVKSYDINEMSKKMGISGEEAGREARYGEFERLAEALGGAKIAVAHNKNDQAETLLMRIMRGTGIDGLKGMSHKRDNIIRPLLDMERSEIEKYCIENKLEARTDSTNLKSIYTRNKVRLELVPFINKTFDTDIVESLYRMSQVIEEDLRIIETFAEKTFSDCIINEGEDRLELDFEKLNSLESGLARRVLRIGIRKIKGDLNGIESIHIEDLLNLIRNGRTGAVIQLPRELRAVRSYNTLGFYREQIVTAKVRFDECIKIPGITIVKEQGFSLNAEILCQFDYGKYLKNASESSLEQFFDYEKLIMGINIRNRKDGDVFKPIKSSGTKKLKKYFIDEKIPRDARDSIPLVAKDSEIIWIVGYKISDNYKVTENTKNILKLNFIQ